MGLHRRIDNWMQVLAAVEYVGAVLLAAMSIILWQPRDLPLAAFMLWMGWRLWTVGCERADARKTSVNPVAQ